MKYPDGERRVGMAGMSGRPIMLLARRVDMVMAVPFVCVLVVMGVYDEARRLPQGPKPQNDKCESDEELGSSRQGLHIKPCLTQDPSRAQQRDAESVTASPHET